jgi:hypothetical protein
VLLFTDNFENDTLGSTAPRSLYIGGGSWKITSDVTNVLTGVTQGPITTPGSTWTDYTVAASVKPSATWSKVIARYQDPNYFYVCGLENGSTLFLGKLYGGTFYAFNTQTYSYSSTAWYTISFTVKGNNLICTATDTATGRTVTASATESYFASGPAGLITSGGAEFDNLVVKTA